jgi:hypothetical protein
MEQYSELQEQNVVLVMSISQFREWTCVHENKTYQLNQTRSSDNLDALYSVPITVYIGRGANAVENPGYFV